MQRALPIAAAAALIVGLVATQSRVALLIWAYDGVIAAAVLAVITLAGLPLLHLLGLRDLPARWRVLFSAGLGIGLAGLLMLGCGLVGWIGAAHRWIAPGIIAAMAVCGLFLIRTTSPAGAALRSTSWWLLGLAPFAALVMLVAVCPPGVLWQEEGLGYDVLEYHLQVPREYYEAGRIAYLPHNVYAAFPLAAEMLYLLAMQVTGQTVEAWGVAQGLNALLAALLVATAWAAGRDRSPQAGWIAGLAAGSCGWLVYLSGLAYIENGMMLTGLLAACALGKALESNHGRFAALSGLLAGLSCGFKYPAVVLIVVPLVVAMLAAAPRRIGMLIQFIACAAIAFSPWLVRNLVQTVNPVFPLLSEHFVHQPAGWGQAEARHFAEVHRPSAEEAAARARIGLLVEHVFTDPDQRFGALVFAIAAMGAYLASARQRCLWVVMLGVQIICWLSLTHLYARFAVPLIIPLALLAACCAPATQAATNVVRAVLAAGMALNLYFAGRLYAEHLYANGRKLPLEGATPLFTQGIIDAYAYLGTVNKELPADAYVLLVGEARAFYVERRVSYCVVFNRNPLAERIEGGAAPGEVVTWMRNQGYTHVLVNWAEIDRLRRSRYGFPTAINRAEFDALATAGLRVHADYPPGTLNPAATLYDVPPR